jgi:hypothetical protein
MAIQFHFCRGKPWFDELTILSNVEGLCLPSPGSGAQR